MALSKAEKRERSIQKWTNRYRSSEFTIQKIFNAPNRVGLAVSYQRLVRVSAADDAGWCVCITCKRPKHCNDIQGGHYIIRTNLATIIDYGDGLLQNVWPQCAYCNDHGKGKPTEFRRFLVESFGEERVDELEQAKLPKNHVWDHRQLATLKVDFVSEIRFHEKRLSL